MTDEKPKLEIDWVKVVAGALAAVSSAVLLSTLGAAGTLIGAALGSMILTVSSAFYSQGIARSKHELARAQRLAQEKVSSARTQVLRAARTDDQAKADEHLERADERLDEAADELDQAAPDEATEALTWRERLALLPWKQIALWAGGAFLIAVLAITAFELVAGRSVSSFTGGSDSKSGTSITQIGRSGSDRPTDSERPDRPDPSESPTGDPTGTPTGTPTGEPTPTSTPAPTPTSPVEPTPTPTGEPTPAPTEPAPSASPTSTPGP